MSVLTVGVVSPPIASGLTLNGYGTTKIALGNTVAVTGNVTMPGYLFCAGMVSMALGKAASTGQVAWTVARVSGFATGVYIITFATAHPLGANYIVNITAVGTMAFLRGSSYAPTSTTFQVVSYQFGTTTLQDAPFSFMALAS